jgi:hypothetical protein
MFCSQCWRARALESKRNEDQRRGRHEETEIPRAVSEAVTRLCRCKYAFRPAREACMRRSGWNTTATSSRRYLDTWYFSSGLLLPACQGESDSLCRDLLDSSYIVLTLYGHAHRPILSSILYEMSPPYTTAGTDWLEGGVLFARRGAIAKEPVGLPG